ncbi:Nuclear transcription factor Y subunit A [Dillenia turbinata]|uniref:Nuclear transcription factor Y subunit n=1 Tax=Dillenia turbinata TaxID=194707 RepID=A0AAN8W187_9MAGN
MNNHKQANKNTRFYVENLKNSGQNEEKFTIKIQGGYKLSQELSNISHNIGPLPKILLYVRVSTPEKGNKSGDDASHRPSSVQLRLWRACLRHYRPLGRIMLPLNLATDEGPIYVNAKQYHGIIRRRQFRAKLELQNKVVKVRKPYLHESRHLHAMHRARGCGGRFLNTKNSNGGKDATDGNKAGGGQLSQPTGSQISEVLQSDGGNLNSKEVNGSKSHPSGSELTSTFSRGEANHFQMNHLHPSVHNMMDGGRGVLMPHKWVAATESCCDLKILPNSYEVLVRVMNRLGRGRAMNVHCQSRDDDLGLVYVPDGSETDWKFTVNLWVTTLFYCALQWDDVNWLHFDAYDHKRDSDRCQTECWWTISEDGRLYGYDQVFGRWDWMPYN